jgi:hypothetical protein
MTMPRLHLFEIQDSAACPRIWRDSMTALMRWSIDLLRVYDPILPHLQTLLQHSPSNQIVDLCSGGAGPWRRLGRLLEAFVGAPVQVSLTDKFPNHDAFRRVSDGSEGRVTFVAASIDATNVPEHLMGVRTLFSSFHHFAPPMAKAILRDAALKGAPIGVFEMTERSFTACLAMLSSPIVAALVIPFLKPRSVAQILSCFPLPLLPLVATWDGMVSNLRTYSPSELDELVADIQVPGYRWETGRIAGGMTRLPLTFLLGIPENKANVSR